jgi:hypothetical protein
MDFELSAGILAAGLAQRGYCLAAACDVSGDDPERADRDGGMECLRGTQPVATRAAPLADLPRVKPVRI